MSRYKPLFFQIFNSTSHNESNDLRPDVLDHRPCRGIAYSFDPGLFGSVRLGRLDHLLNPFGGYAVFLSDSRKFFQRLREFYRANVQNLADAFEVAFTDVQFDIGPIRDAECLSHVIEAAFGNGHFHGGLQGSFQGICEAIVA